MERITVSIGGMACGMCEAHIADTIRKTFPNAGKVRVSRAKGEAAFILEDGFDEHLLIKAIEDIGYTFVSVRSEPYKRRGLFG